MPEDEFRTEFNDAFEIKSGQVLDGRYELISLIARGPVSSVYKAIQKTVDRTVAIKVLNPGFLEPSQFARFQQEIQSLSSLNHSNIVAAYSTGNWNSSVPYIAMEYVDGKSLDKILAEQGALPADLATAIFCQICDALEYAHQMGFIHRDIKPSNVIVENNTAVAKLLDFGLAKSITENSAEQKITKTGALLGSVAYMSPELCSNKKVDKRSDLYSMGCLIYETLTGQQIFSGASDYEIISKHANEAPKITRLDNHYSQVVLAALNKDPDKRIQSAALLKAAILDKNFVWKSKADGLATRPRALFSCLAALIGLAAMICHFAQRQSITPTDKTPRRSILLGHWRSRLSLIQKEGNKHGYSEKLAQEAREAVSECASDRDTQKKVDAHIVLLEALAATKHFDECRDVIATLEKYLAACDTLQNRRQIHDKAADALDTAGDYKNSLAHLLALYAEDHRQGSFQGYDEGRLAECYFKLNQLDTAIEHFEKAIKILSSINSTEGLRLTEDLARAKINLANCYLQKIKHVARINSEQYRKKSKQLFIEVSKIDAPTPVAKTLVKQAKEALLNFPND